MPENRHPPASARELGARIKAARENARIPQPALAKALGVKAGTMSRMERGDPLAKVSYSQLQQIAVHTKTPMWFLTHGFDGRPAEVEAGLEQVVKALEARLAEVERRQREA